MQAQRNANDGVSLIQVAEGGLNEVQTILVRLRELGVQAASDTIGAQERRYLNEEYQTLKKSWIGSRIRQNLTGRTCSMVQRKSGFSN